MTDFDTEQAIAYIDNQIICICKTTYACGERGDGLIQIDVSYFNTHHFESVEELFDALRTDKISLEEPKYDSFYDRLARRFDHFVLKCFVKNHPPMAPYRLFLRDHLASLDPDEAIDVIKKTIIKDERREASLFD
ncbi:hypothetical protein OYT88_14455 [Sporolactobacillus sp. CQH2019]|jgi:hypothetical protein|uniref:hypothetical protein n=1 Tax=Sporolactobacillus sp. CQH2019 TaxID=3023512 RepID=UPI002368E631|nr:hypothetical protein [Sporolactobacillus sp. CQH2019]MDD9149753.1 hypothetical protein [Sporolactobacillus sp. CQH2019]